MNNSILTPYFAKLEAEGASGYARTSLGIDKVTPQDKAHMRGLTTMVSLMVPFSYHNSTLVAMSEGIATNPAQWVIGDYSELTYSLQKARMAALVAAVSGLALDIANEMRKERETTGDKRINKKINTIMERHGLQGLWRKAQEMEGNDGKE